MGHQHLVAWLTLGVAAFVAMTGLLQFLTARNQWRTANNRAVFDLFERRYAVYQEFREIVARVAGSGKADSALSFKAAEALERAQFLFGDELVQYLQRFANSVRDLESYCGEQADLQGDDLKKNLAAQRRSKDAIEEFRSKGLDLFGRYIRFDHSIQ